ncbi:histidine N-acetyltransferase-like [Gigantopelta aegis]|uniref:histidine N-acetyltransferase-like n=1 Tax=Gigantopelta aegis TaxID=1735272 RepID=UPI001B888517|nr:histidine N-acetyltransferase-like [Gigantopelta aegis]
MDDYHDVMAIADVYNGRDHLPSMYEELLASEKSYVSVIDGEIVAYATSGTVDSGQTLVIRAGRIKAKYRGQGLHGTFMKYIRKQFAASRVKYEAFSTHILTVDVKKNRATETCVKNVLCYRFKMKNLRCVSNTTNTEPKRLQTTDLEEVFSSKPTCGHIFPHGKMIVNWVPFRTWISNIDRIIKPNTITLATSDADRSQNGVIYTCLTHGSSFRCKIGLAYSVDVFGDDVIEMRKHILEHMKCIQDQVQGENDDVSLCLFTSSSVNRADIDGVLADTNLPRHNDNKMYQKMRVFEGPFKV